MRPRRYRGADSSLAIRLPTHRDCLPECPIEEGRPEAAENPRHDVRWCPHRQPHPDRHHRRQIVRDIQRPPSSSARWPQPVCRRS